MDNTPKIAILIPTFNNDSQLMKVIESILEVYQENWVILIGDSNHVEDYTFEKILFYGTACAKEHRFFPSRDKIKVHQLPYKCHRIYALNELMNLALKLRIDYCVVMDDKTLFTESFKRLNDLLPYMKNYDLIGFDISGISKTVGTIQSSSIGWLFTSMNLKCSKCNPDKMIIWNCNRVNDFYLATIPCLINQLEEDNLDLFIKYKINNRKVGWTDRIKGVYHE